MAQSLKPVVWLGDSLRVLKTFPAAVQDEMGYAIYLAECAVRFLVQIGSDVEIVVKPRSRAMRRGERRMCAAAAQCQKTGSLNALVLALYSAACFTTCGLVFGGFDTRSASLSP